MSVTSSPPAARTPRIISLVLLVLVVGIALLPWWRNRGYIRSFYDYGVVMGGVGRIEDGQKPYVDFIVPIQTGWFLFNWMAEKIAGGTFQAMTWSGAASIALATFVLGGMLRRRWPIGPSVIVAGGIVCATVVQHTIFWYNPWGVVLLAVVAWGGAIAPVWRREQAGWHALIAAGLFLGGINKINMQLMALCLGAGGAVRAALLGRATWGRVLATAGWYVLFGIMLPVLFEMAWTGASFAVWWHNVIEQMIRSRSGMLLGGLHWRFFLVPCHDYYGALRLPWVGFAGVLLTLATSVALWRHAAGSSRAGLERTLAWVCGVIAFLGGEVLLTTNMDIAYTALGGWLALLVALWLGFGVPARGGWFYGGLVLPAVVMGAVSWEAAWRGQRSQFGYSHAPRSEYRPAEQAGPDFGYLRGTHLPPEMFNGMKALGEWHAALPPARKEAILYAGGTEMLAHIWPARRTPGLPLYILGGGAFGAKEYALTRAAIADGAFKEITVAKVLDVWAYDLERLLRFKYRRQSLESVFFHYSYVNEGEFSADTLYFLERFGGSTDPRQIQSKGAILAMEDERLFIGTTAGTESMRVTVPINRLRGEVVVRRVDPSFTGALAADFAIFAEHDEQHRYPRWSQRVELPAGQKEIVVEYPVLDGSHLGSFQQVTIPPEFAGKAAAGWRGPFIMHAGEDGPAEPKWLRPQAAGVTKLTAEEIAAIFPAGTPWLPADVQLHGGRVNGNQVELEPGGEIWLRVTGLVTELVGTAAVLPDHVFGRYAPTFRCTWVKDARIELFTQKSLTAEERSAGFRGWSAEPGGWIVVSTDYFENGLQITLRFDRLLHQNGP